MHNLYSMYTLFRILHLELQLNSKKSYRMRNDAMQTSVDKSNRFTCTVQL